MNTEKEQKEIEENDDLEKIKLEEYETENIEILKIITFDNDEKLIAELKNKGE